MCGSKGHISSGQVTMVRGNFLITHGIKQVIGSLIQPNQLCWGKTPASEKKQGANTRINMYSTQNSKVR